MIAKHVGEGRPMLVIWVVLAALVGAWSRPAAAQDDPPAVAKALEISEAFKAVAKSAAPSVARISGYTAGGAKVTGSGFIFNPRGFLLTNNHVVESAVSLTAEFSDGRVIPATLVGSDPLTDLAVIRVAGEGLPALPFATSNQLDVGEWVLAVGFPLGLDQTVTIGVISATNRRLNIVGSSVGRRGYEDFIQTDAAINRGNSGGPLLNLRGQVVGVNAVIVTQTGGSDGLGFAIPTRLASYIAHELIEEGRVIRAWMGINLQDLTPALAQSYGLDRNQQGVLLTSAGADTPAGRAGLQVEDILLALDDRPIENVEDLRTQVAMMEPGKTLLVSFYRDGRKRTAEVILDEMNSPASIRRPMIDPSWGGRLGMRLEDLIEIDLHNLQEKTGVLIAQMAPGRLGQLHGLAEGDIIVEVNGEPLGASRVAYNRLSSAKWLYDLIEQSPPGTILRFSLRRKSVDLSGRLLEYERIFSAIELE